MDAPKKKPLMRLLGEFVGHVAHGVKTDPNAPRVEEVRRQTTEETRETPAGPVVLRRTTIEEVVLPPGATPGEVHDAARSQANPPHG